MDREDFYRFIEKKIGRKMTDSEKETLKDRKCIILPIKQKIPNYIA